MKNKTINIRKILRCKDKHIKIILIDYAVAFRIDKKIYINRNLKKFPKLLDAILLHEYEHTDNFGLKDVILDLKGKHIRGIKKEYYKFIIQNPKSLLMYSPILKTDNKFNIDIMMLGIWIFFILILTLTIKLINIIT